jgi:hypothetical protein
VNCSAQYASTRREISRSGSSHRVVRSGCSLAYICSRIIFAASDVVLVHEVASAISNAVNFAYLPLIIVIRVITPQINPSQSAYRLTLCAILAASILEDLIKEVRRPRWLLENGPDAISLFEYKAWDSHVVKAVFFDSFVIKPRAVTSLPLLPTNHAEFGVAMAFIQISKISSLQKGRKLVAYQVIWLQPSFNSTMVLQL